MMNKNRLYRVSNNKTLLKDFNNQALSDEAEVELGFFLVNPKAVEKLNFQDEKEISSLLY